MLRLATVAKGKLLYAARDGLRISTWAMWMYEQNAKPLAI